MKAKQKFSSMGASDKTITVVGNVFLAVFVVAVIIPLLYIVVASFIDPVVLQNHGITFDFSKWTLTAYQRVIKNQQIWIGFGNAVLYSTVFTAISVFVVIFIITMFFNGGLIPTYLLISDLGMLDSMWALILPGAFSVWNMIIARTYYQGVPKELREAASVDGADEVTYFFKVLMPVCKPVIAVLVLWQFVGMWNSYFDALIYISSDVKQPLQLVLRAILIQNQPQPGMIADMQSTAARAQLGELLKYATIIISSVPLLVMFPFFQKHFDAGIMVGSVKG